LKKVIEYLKLARPQNNAIAALSVFVGASVSGPVEFWWKVGLASFSAFLISAGGNCINDVFDVEIDRINKPYRPLVKGEVSTSSAIWFSAVLFSLGILLSLFIKPICLLVAVLASLLLVVYSWLLKKRLLWGNLTVALVSASAFLYGGLTAADFRFSLIPAGLAFLFHLGREIIKDVEDLKGDSSRGASSLPISAGINLSFVLSTLVFLVLMVLTVLPYCFKIFSLLYLLIVIPGVDLVLVYIIWSMWHDPSSPNLHRLSNLLKIDMLLGLAAIYLGRF
jgi:geranylgeranylglycerol-phosphate geranylgeranyltransferase